MAGCLVQGSAADLAKKAMVVLDRRFQHWPAAKRAAPRLLLNIHDELLFEVCLPLLPLSSATQPPALPAFGLADSLQKGPASWHAAEQLCGGGSLQLMRRAGAMGPGTGGVQSGPQCHGECWAAAGGAAWQASTGGAAARQVQCGARLGQPDASAVTSGAGAVPPAAYANTHEAA